MPSPAPGPIAARPSATVLLLRDGPAGLETFMIVRHEAMNFASGALVFPGGSLDPGDHAIAADPARCPPVAGRFPAAYHVAAIRETFEECGILLARPAGQPALIPHARLAPLERQAIPFADLLRAEDLVLATDLLVPFAHWITPANQPRRFETLFLLAPAPDGHVGLHDGAETVGSAWLTPSAAIAASKAGTYKMMFPTQLNLQKLARSPDRAAALLAARNDAIVTVTPELVRPAGAGPRHMRIPAEAGYGGDLFRVENPPGSPVAQTAAP